MTSKKFDRYQLIHMCATVSSGLMGKRAEIEVVSPTDGILVGAQDNAWQIVLLRDPLMLPSPSA
jgi:hypothetical protein